MGNKINIQQLNTSFGVSHQIQFITGKGGFPYIQVNNDKASALISVYAGQVLSYKPAQQSEDLMFTSENAYFQEGKAIKGGTPICWPWFGAYPGTKNDQQPKKPDHGLVRDVYWSVASTSELDNGDNKIVLELSDNAASREIWPYQFYLSLEIVVGETLSLELLTRNTGDQTFSITEAFHTYFNINDITQLTISGLENSMYLDKNADFSQEVQVGDVVITGETDHIYTGVKQQLKITDPGFQREITIRSSGNNNAVVWNPWIKGSAAIKDLDDNDYKHFVCLEIANAAQDMIDIAPGSEYRMSAHYQII